MAKKAMPPCNPGCVRLLKVVKSNMTSYGGFKWPKLGTVSDEKFEPTKECGAGLHAWRWVPGDDKSCVDHHSDDKAKWLVVEVSSDTIIDLGGKCKFPAGVVIYCGDFKTASKMVQSNEAIAGFDGTATAGDAGTATAGDAGTATAGYAGTATAGYAGTATAGDAGTATAGDAGLIVIGDWSGDAYVRHFAATDPNGPVKPGVKYRIENGAFVEVANG